MTTLVIAEHSNQPIKAATLNIVTAAAQCGGDVHVLTADAGCGTAAQAAAQIAGATEMLVVDAPQFADGLVENIAERALAVAGNYNHILAPVAACGKNILPRVAAKLDVAQLFDITEVDGPDTFERPIYTGNAIAIMQSADEVKVITVRGTAFDSAAATGGAAAIENPTAVADAGTSQFVSREVTKSDRPELTAVKIIVSGGRGVGSGENYIKVLTPLADKLGAALGASRAAVDAGFVPNDYQIGQAGKIVVPQLHIAVSISGAIQHLAGMKDSEVIVTINKDSEAPIFQVADYGLVGDLNVVVLGLVTTPG